MASGDGREFMYVLNGAVAQVPGKLYQSPAEVTADENLAVAAAAVGSTTITTTSTVTVTANQYAGGWVAVTVTLVLDISTALRVIQLLRPLL